MTLNPSVEINTNDLLESRGGMTSLHKVREKKQRCKTSQRTNCTKGSPIGCFGFVFFFAYEEMQTSRASSLWSSQLVF